MIMFSRKGVNLLCLLKNIYKHYHSSPFIDLYQSSTGQILTENMLFNLKKKHPTLHLLSHDRLQCSLHILKKFDINAEEACNNPHIFCMNPITVDNYAEILRECGFIKIIPKYIIRYHTIVRSRTISCLKKEGFLNENIDLEEKLYTYLQDLPVDYKVFKKIDESTTSVLTVRLSVLQQFLTWKLLITEDEFSKYCKNYLPLKHKPLSDIQEALNLAQNELKLSLDVIRRNGFIVSSDPINSKLIIDNVPDLAGIDIREAIRIEPALLKNNYNALLKIRTLLEEFRIPIEAQRNCLKVFCMHPKTVEERLKELSELKVFKVLSTNKRVLSMIVYKNKMMNRLEKVQAAKKQCYSLNHLITSSKVFNNYINSFGNKTCGRDIAILVASSLQLSNCYSNREELTVQIHKHMKRHKYWLHTALDVINENIQLMKKRFKDETIFENCHILLYPVSDIENYLENFLKMRDSSINEAGDHIQENFYNNLNYSQLTDSQILSLILYDIEKKYHFSGDGIWSKQDSSFKCNTNKS